MKVALVVTIFAFIDISPPLNLGYLAAYAKSRLPDLNIQVFDGSIDPNAYEKLWLFNPDVLGITATTPQASAAYKLLDETRLKHPGVLTIMGGVHSSILPEEAASHSDYVVVGAGEIAFWELLENKLQGCLPKDKIIYGRALENLDDLPPIDYEMLHLKNYIWRKEGRSFKLPVPVMRFTTSRGCKYACPFCFNSGKARPKQVQYFSAKRIIDDVNFVFEHYGVRSFWFHDDEFLGDKKRFKEFIELLNESKLNGKIKWACQTRVDSLDLESAKLMKANGCVTVFLGIESVSKTLSYLKCDTVTKSDADKALFNANKARLHVIGSFIFGVPNETLKDMRETLNWILSWAKNGMEIGFAILTPYPGTRLYVDAEKLGFNLGKIAYEKFIMVRDPYNAILIDDAIDVADFAKFASELQQFIWIASVRHDGKTWMLPFTRTFQRFLINHPKTALTILLN
jgi:radical SAM superfamily enzyme YgiQ (UPF0313 family)